MQACGAILRPACICTCEGANRAGVCRQGAAGRSKGGRGPRPQVAWETLAASRNPEGAATRPRARLEFGSCSAPCCNLEYKRDGIIASGHTACASISEFHFITRAFSRSLQFASNLEGAVDIETTQKMETENGKRDICMYSNARRYRMQGRFPLRSSWMGSC